MYIQRVGLEWLIRHGKAHTQEIVHIATRIIRVQHRLITATAENIRYDRASLGHDDLGRLIKLIGVGDVSRIRVERGQRVDCGGKHTHRMRGTRERAHERAEILADHGLMVDVGAELLVLGLAWQFAMTQ